MCECEINVVCKDYNNNYNIIIYIIIIIIIIMIIIINIDNSGVSQSPAIWSAAEFNNHH